jgi:hypothetical protein
MTIAMQPIYTQTVAVGGGASITFNNIPQTFTDLMISVSCRGLEASVTNQLYLRFNNVGASGSYSVTRLRGSGSAAFSDRANGAQGDFFYAGDFCPNANATASTFGSANFYIPNYRSSIYKSVIIDGVAENNATFSTQVLTAGLILDTNPITSFFVNGFGNLAQYSTVTLYGITKG